MNNPSLTIQSILSTKQMPNEIKKDNNSYLIRLLICGGFISQLELTNLEENEYKSNKSTDTSRKQKYILIDVMINKLGFVSQIIANLVPWKGSKTQQWYIDTADRRTVITTEWYLWQRKMINKNSCKVARFEFTRDKATQLTCNKTRKSWFLFFFIFLPKYTVITRVRLRYRSCN